MYFSCNNIQQSFPKFNIKIVFISAFLFSTLFSFSVHSTVDFNFGGVPTSSPTLNGLYPDSSSIDSGYTSPFASGDDFTYYLLNSDGETFTAISYDIVVNPSGSGTTFTTQRIDRNGKVPIGYYSVTSASSGGAIYNSYRSLGDITADFIESSSANVGTANYYGGAIYNASTIGNITGDFIKNSIQTAGAAQNYGGAISLSAGSIGNIKGDFLGNYIRITNASANARGGFGGAVHVARNATLTSLTGDFVGNYVNANAAHAGAISNMGSISNGIIGDFIGNYAISGASYAYAGAIQNSTNSFIAKIVGNFIGNYAKHMGAASNVYGGGAIHNMGSIPEIEGNFYNNYIYAVADSAYGGAIFQTGTSPINELDGNFIGNYAQSDKGKAEGGAIRNNGGTISIIDGDFTANYAMGGTTASGGAVQNYSGTINQLIGNFNKNYVLGATGSYGGAVWANRSIGAIYGSFIGNYAEAAANMAFGGAIYTSADLTFAANGTNNVFSGNFTQDSIRNKIYNAIFVNTSSSNIMLTFEITENGTFSFDDTIEIGYAYPLTIDYRTPANITITGNNTGRFFMNNDIINAKEVLVDGAALIFGDGAYGTKGRFLPKLNADGTADLNSPAVTSLILNNGIFDIHNDRVEAVRLKNYTSRGNNLLHIDVIKGAGANEFSTDVIDVSGNILGQTQVVIHGTTDDNQNADPILFVSAPNDVAKTRNAFEVYRVYGNPYMWTASYNYLEGKEAPGSYWYLTSTNNNNPDYNNPTPPPEKPDIPSQEPPIIPDPSPTIEVNPEVMAYLGLFSAGIEQTRNMVDNIKNNLKEQNVWVNPLYYTSTTKHPVHLDADIWGLEAGFDKHYDPNHKPGAFVSYRRGNYDLNGKGKIYSSSIKTEIDINSYVGGLYYRYDKNNFWGFATVYGGIQNADIHTQDGVKTTTDGIEFGTSAEVGYVFVLPYGFALEPSAGLNYGQIDFNDIEDKFGKITSHRVIKYTDAILSLKLEKSWNDNTKLYLKPSIIQTFTSGDGVKITGLTKMKTYDDDTLGRIEFGGKYNLAKSLYS